MQAQDIAREKVEMAMVSNEAVARVRKLVNFGRDNSDIFLYYVQEFEECHKCSIVAASKKYGWSIPQQIPGVLFLFGLA